MRRIEIIGFFKYFMEEWEEYERRRQNQLLVSVLTPKKTKVESVRVLGLMVPVVVKVWFFDLTVADTLARALFGDCGFVVIHR